MTRPLPYAARAASDFCTCPRDPEGARLQIATLTRRDEFSGVIERDPVYATDPACPLHGTTRQEAPF